MSYHDLFQEFAKLSRQREAIAEAIGHLNLESRAARFLCVDIGSNDGVLTEQVMQQVGKRSERVQIYAFEPDVAAYKELARRFKASANVMIDNLDFRSWTAKYSASLEGQIDLVLNSHVIYHFKREEWERVFNQCDKLLAPNGVHIVIVDSNKQPFSDLPQTAQLRKTLDRKLQGAPKVKAYSEIVDGDEVERFLYGQSMRYTPYFIEQPIVILNDEKAAENLAKVFSLIFKYDTKAILLRARDIVDYYINTCRRGSEIHFPRFQDMFVIKKGKHPELTFV